jgi:hypothetical protein
MKHYAFIILLAIVMVSCGTDSRHFKVDGHLLNLNNGEFYVYSPDGAIFGIDTIKVSGGRFTYEISCEQKATLVLIFPNFSEQPIFTEPGKTVDLSGNASHLKEMKVKGTDENKLMNAFREQMANASPPEILKYARTFIEDHPESIVSSYLLNRFFVQTPNANYKLAASLVAKMIPKQPRNGQLKQLAQGLKSITAAAVGKQLPSFSATTINGSDISSSSLKSADVAIISFWASWSYESTAMQNSINELKSGSGGRLKVVSVCVDADKKECRQTLGQDSINWPTVCDGNMFEGSVMKTLGVTSIPDNIVLKRGKIVARGLTTQKLREKVKSLL